MAPRPKLVGNLRRLSGLLLSPLREESYNPSFWNTFLQELWPSIRKMIEEDILKGEVQSVLQESVMAALKFESVSLGEEPPKVHDFRMISSHRRGCFPLKISGMSRPERSLLLVLDTEFIGKAGEERAESCSGAVRHRMWTLLSS